MKRLASRPVLLALFVLGLVPALSVLVAWTGWVDIPYIRFEHPWTTFPAALALGFVALRLLRVSPRLPRSRRLGIELWSAAAGLCAALAASGLELGWPLDRLTVVVAVDRSRSIELVPGASARIATELRAAEASMRPDDRIATVAFGAIALIEDPARPRARLPSPQKADVPRDGTDLGAAIRQALLSIPPDSAARIVLVTDGVATRGDVERAALAATAIGVPVDAVPLDQSSVPNVRVVSVRIAPRAAQGEALDFRVVTQASAATSVEVRVYRDGELVRKGTTRIAAGEDVISLREIAEEPGLHRYDVEISAPDRAQDHAAEDNAGAAFVRVRGTSSALVLEHEPELGRAIADALRSAAFDVDVRGLTGVPADIAGFGRYDLVVLGDISATDLSAGQLEAIGSYVRDLGGGLLLLGGDRSMGPGGYGKTAVEEVSPVSFDLKQERRRASLAEVIAVDYSGSMAMRVGEHTKLELANEAAARSAQLLGAGDRLGILHVDTQATWTVPLGPLSDKAAIAERIRKVQPGGGGILIDLTLGAAYAALAKETVQLKHLLLFSDGADAEERARAPTLVNQARQRGITTSVVALGSGSDVAALARMAELGGGRFYLIQDATRLPAVFAQETILASRSAIHEVSFVPRAAAKSSVLGGVDLAAAPALTGYVVTLPKPRAEVHLVGPEGDPVLATWSAGIGRAGAFTSDYRDKWGVAWTHWAPAARLFGQLGRELARRSDDAHARLEADTAGGQLSVRATVLDDKGRHESLRRLRVHIAGPDGFRRELPLEAVGAGSYAAQLGLTRPGPYLATLIDDERSGALATTGAVLSGGEELRPTGTDRALLRRVSELTSGKLRESLAGVFHDREARRFGYLALSDWLSALAAFALLGSVAFRRLVLPSFGVLRRPARPKPTATKGTSSVKQGTLAVLKRKKKDRVAEPERSALVEPPPAPPPPSPELTASENKAPPSRETSPAPSAGTEAVPRPRTAAEILLERRRNRSPR